MKEHRVDGVRYCSSGFALLMDSIAYIAQREQAACLVVYHSETTSHTA